MTIAVELPALGDDVESATVSQWLVEVGDTVSEGQPIVEVSTDKVDTEIESPAAGVVAEIHLGQDEVALVGATIATIRSAADEPQAGTPAPAPVSAPVEPSPVAEPEPSAPPPPPPEPVPVPAPVAASPASAAEAPGDALRGTTQKLTRLRKVIASRMVDSLQTSAQLTTIVEVDITEVGRIRRQHNRAVAAGGGVKLSFLPFIAVAALRALRDFPQVNCSIDLEAGTVTYPDAEHLGMAVDTEKGLFVPVIRHAGDLSVTDLALRIADVAERTRASRIGVDELSGGTFTITNTGSRGALMDTPIINQPQAAILGAGVVTRRPVIVGSEDESESIAIRSMIYLSLTYDHRVVDGADAARYLSAVKSTLERGSFELGTDSP